MNKVVILFVRMWVEMPQISPTMSVDKVILFVRMWVEISFLIFHSCIPLCHPLREDVSWNLSHTFKVHDFIVILFVRMWVEISRFTESLKRTCGHPLREDVSWNTSVCNDVLPHFLSSSSWGCELKWAYKTRRKHRDRHPLCEDVSWNDGAVYIEPWEWVILFVRMWVEMMLDTVVLVQVAVILLVKMWVEILKSMVLIIVVAIWFFLWGGELKYPW